MGISDPLNILHIIFFGSAPFPASHARFNTHYLENSINCPQAVVTKKSGLSDQSDITCMYTTMTPNYKNHNLVWPRPLDPEKNR